MSNFAFPPPPPPPPKAAGVPETSNYGLPQRGRGRGRGDRGSRDNSRGGGRGRDFSAGHVGVDGSRGNRSFSNLRGPRVSNDTYSSHDRFAPDGAFRGQKRKRDDFQRVPKPQAAPAVPSFGGPLLPGPANVATKPTLSDSSQGDVPRTALSKVKANALGLTPYGDSSDDEVEDDDEAAMAAAAAASSGSLQVSYGGKTLDLGSKETLQAWLAERKRNWPTKARNAVRKQAELKKQQESLRQKLEADQARRKAQAERQEVKAEQKAQEQLKRAQHPPVPEKKVSKIDKLRLKLEKAEAKAAAKASKSKAAAGNSDGPASDPTQAGAEASSETASAEVDLSEESSVLSSSGDDTTDSDAESGSGIPASPPPKASKPEPIDGRKAPNKLCHAFAAKGHCPRGRRCPYKHERQPKHPQSRARKPFEPLKRKSLFQRFVEQEEAAEKHKPARSDRMPDQQP